MLKSILKISKCNTRLGTVYVNRFRNVATTAYNNSVENARDNGLNDTNLKLKLTSSDQEFIELGSNMNLNERYKNFLERTNRSSAIIEGIGEGVELSIFSYNYMLRGLSKSNSSYQQFETLFTDLINNKYPVEADINTYNIGMEGYINYYKYDLALAIFNKLMDGSFKGIQPNVSSFNCMFKLYLETKSDTKTFLELLKSMLTNFNLSPDIYTLTLGLQFCSLHKDLETSVYIRSMVDQFQLQPDVMYYNAMLNSFVSFGLEFQLGLDTVDTLLNLQLQPTSDTILSLIKLAKQNQILDEKIDTIIQLIIEHKVKPCIDSLRLLNFKFTSLELVELLANNAIEMDIKYLNKMLNYEVKNNNFKLAFKLGNFMVLNNLTPTIHSYSILIEAYIKVNKLDKAMDLYEELKLKKLVPDPFIYRSLIEGLGKKHGLQRAFIFYTNLKQETKANPIINRYISNSMLGLCVLDSNLKVAKTIVKDMKDLDIKPDIRSFNSILAIYINLNDTKNVLNIYKNLVDSQRKFNLQPDYLTYTLLIKYFLRKKDLNQAIKFYNSLMRSNYKLDSNLTSNLIRLATLNGEYDLGLQVYAEFVEYAVNTNRLIKINKHSGNSDEGESKFITVGDNILNSMVKLCRESNRYLTLVTNLKNLAKLTLNRQLPSPPSSDSSIISTALPSTQHSTNQISYNTFILILDTCLKFEQFTTFFELVDLFKLSFNFEITQPEISQFNNIFEGCKEEEFKLTFKRRFL